MAQSLDNPFWRYSLAIYGRPGIMEACLGLQDRHGLDVNLLLFCCWAGAQGRNLTPNELGQLVSEVDDWQREVVQPLRRARRFLKGRTGAADRALRDSIKASELDAECTEQEMLYRALPIAGGEAATEIAVTNLRAYLAFLEVSPSLEDSSALALLAEVGLSIDV